MVKRAYNNELNCCAFALYSPYKQLQYSSFLSLCTRFYAGPGLKGSTFIISIYISISIYLILFFTPQALRSYRSEEEYIRSV